jgi:hypothetical protein
MAYENAVEAGSRALRATIERRDTCSRRRAARQGLSRPAATTRSARRSRPTALVVAIAVAMIIAATLNNGHSQMITEPAPDKEAPVSMVLVGGAHHAPSSGQTIRTAETTPPAPVATPLPPSPIRATGPCAPGTPCPIPTPTRGHLGYGHPQPNSNPIQHGPGAPPEQPQQAAPPAKPTAIGEFIKRHLKAKPPRKP